MDRPNSSNTFVVPNRAGSALACAIRGSALRAALTNSAGWAEPWAKRPVARRNRQ
jgi:hypothetical protein